MNRHYVTIAMAAGAALLAGIAAAQLSESISVPARESDAAGAWELNADSDARPQRAVRPLRARTGSKGWRAHIVRGEDNMVTGELAAQIGDAAIVTHGAIRGRAQGATVWGEIFDDDGKQVATFEATRTPDGILGRFTTRDDETGTFAWDQSKMQ
ncbi:MAG: hypothetical protein HYR72_18710 [Deltaproteobacteria bacterium]|nr:hypothetical protein [Deltaproteobacteria bacterium]MBI3386247.1 hypothetical protein [Deltaproteobacteria bacterium]